MSLKVMSPILSVMSNAITSEVTISEVIVDIVVVSYNRLECLSPASPFSLYRLSFVLVVLPQKKLC